MTIESEPESQVSLYTVLVRAIVRSDDEFLSLIEIPNPWSSYDYQNKDGKGVLRLESLVKVHAKGREDAIKQAINSAPEIDLGSHQAEIELWVDDEQDDDIVFIKAITK